jgi:hypothetical protein
VLTPLKVLFMRTLVDLLNNDHAYVRIFADADDFGYELCTYVPRPIPDLFERMSGYASADDAYQAAQHQLSAAQPTRRNRSRKNAVARAASI